MIGTMKIIKPLTLGILCKPYSIGGRHYFSLAALGFFTLGQPNKRFLLESTQWPKALKHLGPEEPLDMAMPKGKAEFLIGGNAWASGGKPIDCMQVVASVGDFTKVLKVHGDREWYYGTLGAFHISKAKPFKKMCLNYQNALGGEKSLSNPIGKGFYPNRFAWLWGSNKGAMPNLEYIGDPVSHHINSQAPAAFGSVDLRWQPRASRAGTYDEHWMQNGFPGLADDTKMTLFNQAAVDQWGGSQWQGGESYLLEGMHPEKPSLNGKLPEFCVKALVETQQQSKEHRELIDLVADTVWFFPEEELGIMIYRGVIEVTDSDAMDVQTVLLAYEGITESPKQKAHYETAMSRRKDRSTVAAEVLNEAALIPKQERVKTTSDLSNRKAKTRAFIEALQKETSLPDDFLQSGLISGEELSEAAKHPDPEITMPDALSQPLTLEEIAAGGVDLGDALQELRHKAADLQKKKEQELADEQQRLQKLMVDLAPAVETKQAEAKQLAKALEQAQVLPADLHPNMGSLEKDKTQLLQLLKESANDEEQAEVQEQMINLLALERQAKAKQPQINDKRERLTSSNAKALGQWVEMQIQEGQSLAGRDLTDVSMANFDFSGMDLREINFEQADLAGCQFNDANLSGANLLGAKLDCADFSGATLCDANLSQSQCAGVKFDGSNLQGAMLVGANFTGASLRNVNMSQAIASKAILTCADLAHSELTKTILVKITGRESIWHHANLNKTVLANADIKAADFTGASLERSILNGVKASGSVWDKCAATRCFFGAESEFSQTSWREADFRTCGMRASDYTASDMTNATFFQCDFSEAVLSQVRASQSVFCRSLFTNSAIDEADLRETDLHQAICRKADFSRSNLSGSNLVHTDMIGTVLEDATLENVRERAA